MKLNRIVLSSKVLISSLITLVAIYMYMGYNVFGASENSTNDPRLILKDEKLFNMTYGEWIAKWWQWDVKFPAEKHPSEHYIESECGKNQTGPVWFLPDYIANGSRPIITETEERTCHIPSGKYVLAGINTGLWWTDTNESDDEIIRQATPGQEKARIVANINGTPLDILSNRANTGIFNLSVPADNLYTSKSDPKNYTAGIYRAYADGHFLFYGPLKPGNYNVFWEFTAGGTPIGNDPVHSVGKITYHLIVK
jgi:hypothetical protein